MIDPEKFQGEVMRWNLHNFPNPRQYQPLLGVVEEIGELMEADAMLFACPEKAGESYMEFRDAIGDVAIYCAVFCGLNGIQLFEQTQKMAGHFAEPFYSQAEIRVAFMIVSGRLCHSFLKDDQGIRGHGHRDKMAQDIGKIMDLLSAMCRIYDIDFLECITDAWEEVSQRDWIKYPRTGRPEGEKKQRPKRELPGILKDKPRLIPKERWSMEAPF